MGHYMADYSEKTLLSMTPNHPNGCTTLEEIVADACSCKLRTTCPDKQSAECLKDRNLYREFMLARAKH
jgi:hypothetical protein